MKVYEEKSYHEESFLVEEISSSEPFQVELSPYGLNSFFARLESFTLEEFSFQKLFSIFKPLPQLRIEMSCPYCEIYVEKSLSFAFIRKLYSHFSNNRRQGSAAMAPNLSGFKCATLGVRK